MVNRNTYHIRQENCQMKSFGERLKFARQAAGLSQRALAAKAGLSQPTISDAESGQHAGSSSTARLADALNVNPLWLEEGRGPMRSDEHPHSERAEALALLKALPIEKVGLVLALLREISPPKTDTPTKGGSEQKPSTYGRKTAEARQTLLGELEGNNSNESKGHRVSKSK